MKKILVLLIMIFTSITVNAQSGYTLIAQKELKQKIFERNERIKIVFKFEGTKAQFIGRLDAVYKDSIYVRGLRKRNRDHIAIIAIKDITKIKQVFTGARTTMGIVGMFGGMAGVAVLADALSNEAIFFSNTSVAMGVGAIIASQVPYLLVTLAEKSYSTKRQFEFRTSDSFKKAL